MAATATLRAPYDLPQHDVNACTVSVTAQVRYMYGLDAVPAPHHLDTVLGRTPGQALYGDDMLLHLLGEGFRMHSIYPRDNARFLREGLAYVREFYAEEWTPALEAYFTPEQVKWLQDRTAEDLAEFARFGDAHTEEIRMPTLDDLRQWVTRPGTTVYHVQVGNPDEVVVHSTLLYGMADGEVQFYSPRQQGSTLFNEPEWYFLEEWIPKEGITAIWRP